MVGEIQHSRLGCLRLEIHINRIAVGERIGQRNGQFARKTVFSVGRNILQDNLLPVGLHHIPHPILKSRFAPVGNMPLAVILQAIAVSVDREFRANDTTNVSSHGGTEILPPRIIILDVVVAQDNVFHTPVPVGRHKRNETCAIVCYASLHSVFVFQYIQSRRFPVYCVAEILGIKPRQSL